MPRGGMKIKPPKAPQANPAPSSGTDNTFVATKPARRNTGWGSAITKPTFLSRNTSDTKLASPLPPQPQAVVDQNEVTPSYPASNTAHSTIAPSTSQCSQDCDVIASDMSNEVDSVERPPLTRNLPLESTISETYEEVLDTVEDLAIDDIQSSASSTYSRDRLSIYSSDSASIYSSASSIYSSGASIYSLEEDPETPLDGRMSSGLQYQQRPRPVSIRRTEVQDAASRERSSLARKAAMFQNSRLPPQLPSFTTSLPTWSMVCRAVEASQDCYDSRALTRRGAYTPADTSKDIKAMIIDDQSIDDSRLVIVSIRGTELQSLADWSVNLVANPVKPVGFLDEEDNFCHEGFLQVAKAMVAHVAKQLKQHPASSENPSLLFTGHSAGGAVAAMLYSHMVSTSLKSDLTELAKQFSSINCITFGAPPISIAPRLKRDHVPGVFIAVANEGDPVLRLSNAAYLKSMVKLMTASPPTSASSTPAPPPVKVVRGSRGTRVIRQSAPAAPAIPWEELPLWPTPAAPLCNAGDVVLLRDRPNGSAVASRVTPEDLSEVIFADLAQHGCDMYERRVKDVAFAAMMGRTNLFVV